MGGCGLGERKGKGNTVKERKRLFGAIRREQEGRGGKDAREIRNCLCFAFLLACLVLLGLVSCGYGVTVCSWGEG